MTFFSHDGRTGNRRIFHILLPPILSIVLFVLLITVIILPAIRKNLLRSREHISREMANIGISIVDSYRMRADAGELTKKDAQRRALARITSLRYGPGNTDYYWLVDSKCRMLAHPFRRDLIGRDLSDFRDIRGKRIVLPIVTGALKTGYGKNTYYWEHFGHRTNIVPKLSVGVFFKPWNWVIATGVYLDDFEKNISDLTTTLEIVIALIILLILGISVYNSAISLSSDRKNETAQQELEKQRSHLLTTLRSIGDGVIVTDRDSRILTMNGTAEEITGWREEECGGNHFRTVLRTIHSEENENGNSPENLFRDTILIDRSDREIPISETVAPITGADGILNGHVIVFRDISEQSILQEKIVQTNMLLRGVITQSFVPMLLVGKNGMILHINRACMDLLGISEEIPAGTNISEIHWDWDMYTEDGRSIPPEESPIILSMRGIPTRSREIRIMDHTGINRHAITEGVPIRDTAGNLLAGVTVFTDITDRKKALEDLKNQESLLNESQRLTKAGGWELDLRTGKTRWTRETYRIHGFNPDIMSGSEEVPLFEVTLEQFSVPDREILRQAFEKCRDKGVPYDLEFDMSTIDEQQIRIRTTGQAEYENGKIVRIFGDFVDITEQYQARLKAKKDADIYRLLTESSTDVIWLLNLDMKYTYISPHILQQRGFTPEEAMKMSLDETIAPAGLNAIKKIFREQETLPREQQWLKNTLEVELFRKDGSTFWSELVYQGIRDENGEVVAIQGSSRDITKRKKAEKEIRERDALLQGLLDSVPDMIAVMDENMNIIYCNWKGYGNIPSEQRKTGEACYRTLRSLDDTCPGCRAKNSLESGEPFHTETELPDGSWVELRTLPIPDVDGKSSMFVEWVRDITERKNAERELRESEAKLSSLFGSMTEMVALHELVFDEQGAPVNYRITDCNTAYSKILGIPRENAVNRLATEVYATETPPYLEEFSRVAMSGKSFEYTTHFEPMDKHFIISVVAISENKFATITTDISPIIRTQELIASKNKELENYLYVASHDLRSPLVNIQGFSQRLQKQTALLKDMMEDCNLDSETQTKIDEIYDSSIPKTLNYIFTNVTKMDTLINGLLQISRTGRVKMTIAPVDMNDLLNEVLKSFAYEIEEAGATVSTENLPRCYGDHRMLNQLFSNLISNAIKYRAPDRPLSLSITGSQSYNKSTYTVKDNGIGIRDRHLSKIWDVFYRVENRNGVGGEGIGLSLVKRITDKHRGRITAASEFGKGSVFTLTLINEPFDE